MQLSHRFQTMPWCEGTINIKENMIFIYCENFTIIHLPLSPRVHLTFMAPEINSHDESVSCVLLLTLYVNLHNSTTLRIINFNQ